MVAKLKEMKCSIESTESLTSRLKVVISSSVYMTINPRASSFVASSSCLVELLLVIFWAVFTGFSRLFVVANKRGFFMPLQEFVVHFKTGKNLWLNLKTLLFVFGSSKADDGFENTLKWHCRRLCYNLTIVMFTSMRNLTLVFNSQFHPKYFASLTNQNARFYSIMRFNRKYPERLQKRIREF